MKRILIDMDDVMAETGLKIIATYNKLFGTTIKAADFDDERFEDIFTVDNYKLVREEIFKKGFFADLKVKPDAVEVVKDLNDKYEVFIVSAATEFPNSLSEKTAWLAEHFPFITWQQTVYCGYKFMIKADIMIDDHIKNLDPFEGETKLLFDAMHNQTIDDTNYQRVKTWREVADILL